MKLIYAKEFVVVEHDQPGHQLHITWWGFITGEEYIQTVRELLRLTAEHCICSWLCDMRGAEGIREADVRWEESCITGSPYGSRLLRVARLTAPGQTYCNLYELPAGKLPEFREFISPPEARNWLNELKPEPCLSR